MPPLAAEAERLRLGDEVMVRLLTPFENHPESCGACGSPSADANCVPCDAAEMAAVAHPGREAKPDDLLDHALTIHHPQLRDQLLWVGSLLDKIVAHSGDQSLEGRAIVSQFTDFQYELVSCLLRERCVLYPRIARRGQGDFSSAAGLTSAIRQVEQAHARALQKLWRLVELASSGPPALWELEALSALRIELSLLRDDYYQHLFEVECLLLPQVSSSHRT